MSQTSSPPFKKVVLEPIGVTSPVLEKAIRTRDPKLPELLRNISDPTDFTDILRSGMTNAYLRRLLLETLGLRPVPLLASTCLFPHQISALVWMQQRERVTEPFGIRGGMLSMTMGLGKTLTSLVASFCFPTGLSGPTLIIASKTVVTEWKANIEKFFDTSKFRVLLFHREYLRDAFERVTADALSKFDLVLTTYDVCLDGFRKSKIESEILIYGEGFHRGKVIEICQRSSSALPRLEFSGSAGLYGVDWNRVIADESQRFANPKTTTYRAMMGIGGRLRWCITGTPVRNYDVDMWSQFRFLGYSDPKFRSAVAWKKMGGAKTYHTSGLADAVLMMGYSAAGITLPPRGLVVEMVKLDGMNLACYNFVHEQTVEAYRRLLAREISFACVLAMFIRMRQCCIAPWLMVSSRLDLMTADEIEGDNQARTYLDDKLSSSLRSWIVDREGEAGMGSPKISAIVRTVQSIPPGEKILIFSMFTTSLSLVGSALLRNGIWSDQIDGSVSGKEREAKLLRFRTDPKVQVLLLNYKVGSEGLTLIEATHCLCIEPWWSPAVHRQAEARIWRMGQTNPVTIYRILVKGTIEERILRICDAKEQLSHSYFEGIDRTTTGLSKAEMANILGLFDSE